MGIFKKKNKATEAAEEKKVNLKQLALEAVNEKLNGTLYDDCIIMPKGYTIDVQIGRNEESNGVRLLAVIYIIKNDMFDEPIIDPVDAQGRTEEEAVKMAADIFFAGIWHPLSQSMIKKNPTHISVDYLNQHYDFDMYAQSVVRIGVSEEKTPTMLLNYIREDIPKYLGSKKYYWIRIFLAKMKEKTVIEVRINGTVCSNLAEKFKEYVESWGDTDRFLCEKQYGVFVQREDDMCPFNKELVVNVTKRAIELLENCNSPEEYKEIIKEIEELAGDKALASEIRIFVPEILAKLTIGYGEGDSLFLMKDGSSIEFRKTQLRSYFYIQQVLLEYLSKRPEQERVMKIVANSVAFREVRKAHEAGHEPKDLYVPGTSYSIGLEDYKVW
ncbi:MAG: hypothetical protein IJC65_05585 [Oscillospiraceae bacterium]|nr:hypothetical protein [Oscillospiraceae bacterium]